MLMKSSVPSEPDGDPIAAAFAREERSGLIYALWGRLVVLGALLFYVLATLPVERSLRYAAIIVLFMALGAVPHLMRRWGLVWIGWTIGFMLLEVAILTYLLIVPPPFIAESWTPQINLRLPNFLYLGVFLVGMALSYSPALVVWTGAASMVAWSAGVLWVASLPGSIAGSSKDALDGGLTPQELVKGFLDPNYVALTSWYNQLVFLALVTLILAITVWRSRRLVRRQVVAESERSNLSRYFSPNLVDALAGKGNGIDQVASHNAAILFADMVGFTTLSEKMAPEAMVAMLRDFHGRLARTIFAHGGTLDKYMGDAVMAHFGTPRPGPDDASRALACGLAMVREIETWNVERAGRAEPAIRIGVGIHYGPVVAGNIGDARRLEYTVLGDTVNVASRIEALTRKVGSPLVASDDLITAMRAEKAEAGAALLKSIKRDREQTVRGRTAPVALWSLNSDASPPAQGPRPPSLGS
jgi:adenylate cyclase